MWGNGCIDISDASWVIFEKKKKERKKYKQDKKQHYVSKLKSYGVYYKKTFSRTRVENIIYRRTHMGYLLDDLEPTFDPMGCILSNHQSGLIVIHKIHVRAFNLTPDFKIFSGIDF